MKPEKPLAVTGQHERESARDIKPGSTSATSPNGAEGARLVEMERPPCLLCGALDAEAILEGSDRLHGLPGRFGVVRCSRCGHYYTSPRPKDLQPYYPTDYGPHQKSDSDRPRRPPSLVRRLMLAGFLGYPGPRWPAWAFLWPLWASRHWSADYTRVIPWTGRGRLFDFGCGAGRFLSRMRRIGWSVAGMDFSENAVGQCRERGLDVRQGTLPDANIREGSFDVVTFLDSLEHVTNPREAVAEARRILSPGGLIVISTPLCDSLAYRWTGADCFAWELPRHLSHFRHDTLERLLREEGFEEIHFRARRRPDIWKISFARRFESRGGRLNERLSRAKWICALIDLWSCVLGRSSTAVVLARKPFAAAIGV
jgi:SAM-dependent methyltransferase